MLASLPASEPPLVHPDFVYEPKYDGIRAIALIEPPADSTGFAKTRFWSRLGNEKTAQFPELVATLGVWGRHFRGPLVLDGEIVALDRQGAAGRLSAAPEPDSCPRSRLSVIKTTIATGRTADGLHRLRLLPRRRPRPAGRCRSSNAAPTSRSCSQAQPPPATALRISEQVAGDGRTLYARAKAEGWEGLLVKRAGRSIATAAAAPSGSS